MQNAYAKKNNWRGLSKKEYNSLSDEDERIVKDSEVYRFQLRGDKNRKPATYISTNKEDRNQYRAMLPINYAEQYTKGFEEVKYKAVKDLVSPSAKKRVDAWIEQINEDPETRRYVANKLGYGKAAYGDAKKVGLKSYKMYISDQGEAGESVNSKYFRRIAEKGYNAIIDDQDQGVMSSTPMAVIDKSALQKTGSKYLKDRDFLIAAANYKAPSELKRRAMI